VASAEGKPSDPDDPGRRERIRGQVKIIVDALDDVAVAPGASDDVADFAHLYRRQHLLVRDRDLARVTQELDQPRDGDPVVSWPIYDALDNGITRLELGDDADVLEVLDRLDRVLGVGVATPDPVVWVTPSGCCPATEPEETAGDVVVPAPNLRADDGKGVLVSVVDTGWHTPAATDPLTRFLDHVSGDEETIDPDHIHPYAGHGTFVAGVVRCQAPHAEVRVEGFLTNGGAIYESEIIKQLCDALALGPDIISLSAGTVTRGNRPSLAFEVFHDNFLSQLKGTVLVAAAGNDSTRQPFWPAAFPWAVSVGAVDATGARAGFSNYGSWVDVYALGVDLVNAFPHGTYTCTEPPHVGEVRHFHGLARWSGTSFSTPVVAGRIAARMSRSGLNARQAADELLAEASANAIPGVGAVL
jgi:subtilisin family serine protease